MVIGNGRIIFRAHLTRIRGVDARFMHVSRYSIKMCWLIGVANLRVSIRCILRLYQSCNSKRCC